MTSQPAFACSKLTIETLEEIRSELTIETTEQRQWRQFSVQLHLSSYLSIRT